ATQAVTMRAGLTHWRTMVFTVLTFIQMAQILAIRSERTSLFKLGLTSNLPLLGAEGLTLALQLAVIYVPALNPIFYTAPLRPMELLACFGASGIVLAAVELDKWIDKWITGQRARVRASTALGSPR
ncbi:MAG TPA: cation-translocating P-type ATPase C-terminal domain-containing protein, partial [Terriglobales bacterium]|nr:cation-translocating P-type ATPase C-terminal domain-containing protein [Terriglobales bacterium]